MAYVAWSVSFGEQPSAAKWNILGSNDASFNDGTGIGAVLTNANLSTTTGALGGAWQDWTPSYVNITVGNGTVTAKYIQIGKTVHFFWKIVCGSTTAISNNHTITPPVTPNARYTAHNFMPVGVTNTNDVTGNDFAGWVVFTTSGNFNPLIANYAGSNGQITSAFPITEASGDTHALSGTYEAA